MVLVLWAELERGAQDILMAGHYWSLAVEEQFYLLWPLAVRRLSHRQILKVAIAGSALSVPLRLALLAAHVDRYHIYRNTFTRMDTLFIGAACACLLREELVASTLRRYIAWLWIAPVGVLGIVRSSGSVVSVSVAAQAYGYTIIGLSYASLLLGAVLTIGSPFVLQRFFASAIMRAFGKYSYAAYVWHRMIAAGIQACERKTHMTLPWFVEIPLMIAATFAVSMASYALIERPFLTLKRYFEPRYALAASAH